MYRLLTGNRKVRHVLQRPWQRQEEEDDQPDNAPDDRTGRMSGNRVHRNRKGKQMTPQNEDLTARQLPVPNPTSKHINSPEKSPATPQTPPSPPVQIQSAQKTPPQHLPY